MIADPQSERPPRVLVLFDEDPVRVQVGSVVLSVGQFERLAYQVSKVSRFLRMGLTADAGPDANSGSPGEKRRSNDARHTRIVTVDELALILNVGRSTIYRLTVERRIPVLRLGRSMRFKVDEVLEALRMMGEDMK